MSDLPTAVSAYLRARADADSAPPWARIMREDVAAARMRELLAACFADDVSLDDALVLHAPDFVREQAQEWSAMAAKIAPPAPVVLGPWRYFTGTTMRYREFVGTTVKGLKVRPGGWSVYDGLGAHLHSGGEGGEEGMSAVDADARSRGWVLLDAEPLPEPVALGAWHTDLIGRRFRATASPGHLFCALAGTCKGAAMTDMINNLSAAFKARDLGWIQYCEPEVIAAADSDLLALWVSYSALLEYRQRLQDFHHDNGGYARSQSVYATLNALLARLDTAWTAYLSLRAQQEPDGE